MQNIVATDLAKHSSSNKHAICRRLGDVKQTGSEVSAHVPTVNRTKELLLGYMLLQMVSAQPCLIQSTFDIVTQEAVVVTRGIALSAVADMFPSRACNILADSCPSRKVPLLKLTFLTSVPSPP